MAVGGEAPPPCATIRLTSASGSALPWLLDDQLWQLKVRTNRQHPKYVAVSGGHACLFGLRRSCLASWQF